MAFEEQLEQDWRREQETCRRRFEAGVAAMSPFFATAHRVQSALFLPLSWPTRPVDSWNGFDCYVLGKEPSREKAADFAARLGRLVLNADSYQMAGGGVKLCIFSPTVGFRVWGSRGAADVVLCLGCSELIVLESDPSVPMHTIGGQEGRFRICGDFDPVAASLTALTRESLPDWKSNPWCR